MYSLKPSPLNRFLSFSVLGYPSFFLLGTKFYLEGALVFNTVSVTMTEMCVRKQTADIPDPCKAMLVSGCLQRFRRLMAIFSFLRSPGLVIAGIKALKISP